ncbi:dioxygenase [Microbacterium sp. W1N]|uniref:dioxygenase n=1 Tax=Microbacterium festucae TaxID=2977531 RepID=UPI0021C12B3E|nr:dioxygenase [Microbacterium festucae]MCT9820110.1 dioxygenase [Microbacterium festucae]
MATGANKRQTRAERDRGRLYQARRDFHAGLLRRRRRDNLIAGVAGGVLILAVLGGQVAYYTVGPGTPAPAPSPSATPTGTVAPTDPATPAPTPTDVETEPVSPTPTP